MVHGVLLDASEGMVGQAVPPTLAIHSFMVRSW